LKFLDNENGTITDTLTGLIWQKEATEETMTWEKAQEYCENLSLNGYTDWRLPAVKELLSLVDYSRYNPATKMPNTSSSFYWSSTTYAYNTNLAWGVYFSNGNDSYDYKDNSNYVRAVRGE
jgi:hypothetical protein